jgi:hypothetical protein
MNPGLSQPRRTKAPKRPTQALAARIRDTLLTLGGEAHRRTVIEKVARDMGVDVRNIPEELEAAVILSFEESWRDEAQRASYGFHLRFGEGSHRWAVLGEVLAPPMMASARRSAG